MNWKSPQEIQSIMHMGVTSDLYNTWPKNVDSYIPLICIKKSNIIFGQSQVCKDIVIYIDPFIKTKGKQCLVCRVTNYVQKIMSSKEYILFHWKMFVLLRYICFCVAVLSMLRWAHHTFWFESTYNVHLRHHIGGDCHVERCMSMACLWLGVTLSSWS